MQRQHVLLRLALNRNEPHRWPSYRFADRFGVARIILVRLHVWPHEARTHQPDLVTAIGNLASPIVGSAARLHRHQARLKLRHKPAAAAGVGAGAARPSGLAHPPRERETASLLMPCP